MHVVCRDLTFHYPGAESAVLRQLSLHLQGPGFLSLFGPSGVGKTSLARVIAGLAPASGGSIGLDGIQRVLYSYNAERLPGWASIARHLEKITPPGMNPLCEQLIEAFGLTDCMDQRFSQLSLGQKNRINLVRYLVQDFQLLIMDESLANVDERRREKILLTIKRLFDDRLFLYISHNVIEVATFCARIAVMRDPGKPPQATWVNGQDHRWGAALDRGRLDKTMLEVMNAG